ncbi:MAG: hypothetical protein AAB411_01960 [Patescibacteria group bacterium]
MDTMALLAIIGLLVIAGGGILFLKAASRCSAPTDDSVEEKKEMAAYYSRRRGLRQAEIVDRRKGRVILHVLVHPAGVTVRRQSRLLL